MILMESNEGKCTLDHRHNVSVSESVEECNVEVEKEGEGITKGLSQLFYVRKWSLLSKSRSVQ